MKLMAKFVFGMNLSLDGYVDHQSFLLDLKIVLMTLYKVIKSEGISAEGHATMPKFSDHMKSKTPR